MLRGALGTLRLADRREQLAEPGRVDVERLAPLDPGKLDRAKDIAAVLVVLWFLGLVTSFTLGGFIHVLLVIAIIVILIRLIRGENPLK